MVEDFTPEDWFVREVYAKFGLAIYECQSIEKAIVTILVLLRLKEKGKYRAKELVKYERECHEMTFGQLIKRKFEKESEIPKDLIKYISNFLELRKMIFWKN